MFRHWYALACLPLLLGVVLLADNVGATTRRAPETPNLTPLTELGERAYQGFPGGLYPDGKNERPAAHEKAGLALARQVQPLDAGGKPSPDGKIVLLTVGMSNTAQASQALIRLASMDPAKNPRVV